MPKFMPKYESIDVIYVGDREDVLTEKNVWHIKSYKIIENDMCYHMIMKTTDNRTIGPYIMTYDTFEHLFTKGFISSVAREIQ